MNHALHSKTRCQSGARVPRLRFLCAVLLAAGAFVAAPATAQEGSASTLDRLMKASSSTARVHISPVRKAALQAAARTLGMQTGLTERAQEINAQIKAREAALSQAFRFGDMVIGAGVLPPVIVKTEGAQAVRDNAMRIASGVYRLVAPARFFAGAPSWRDWLLLGLPVDDPMPQIPTNPQLLPQDERERAFWEQEVREAYLSGREQAQEIFDDNLARLEETYFGMRTFYDLYQRKMVSAPVIAKSQEILTHDDPNTIIVGDTLFRITVPAQFTTNPDDWLALAAPPDTQTPLPVVAGFDPQQVAIAYEVFRETQARRQALKEGKAAPVTQAAATAPAAPSPAQAQPVEVYRVTPAGTVAVSTPGGASVVPPSGAAPAATSTPAPAAPIATPAPAPSAGASLLSTPLFVTAR